MVGIARALNRTRNQVQLIMLCGKNEKGPRASQIDDRLPMFVEGFTREVPLYMELADFFIGKPGPGSISEALARTAAGDRVNATPGPGA